MATGSSLEVGKGNQKPASMLPEVDPFLPKRDHNPKELKSWAKRTGFVSNLSGETSTSVNASSSSSTRKYQDEKFDSDGFDLEKGMESRGGSSSPKIEIDPILGRAKTNKVGEIKSDSVRDENRKKRVGDESVLVSNDDDNVRGKRRDTTVVTPVAEVKKADNGESEVGIDGDSDADEQGLGSWPKVSELKCGLRDNPGFVPLIYYGLQHYLSLIGSLIFIPLIVVPAMGGTDKDTATLISTMLLISGVSTILHSYFGTRLPLVQGSSFVYLAPALAIINSQDYRNLTEHKFRRIMRELQGAIIIGSLFQCFLGFSGFMFLLLRLINPVVVAPTLVAVGLAFFSYGFPQAGSCVEISIPQILLILIFTLYLRKISVFGHHIFRIYAVPLSGVIIWAYAFLLTAGGAYDYKGCSTGIPSSNMLMETCIKHAYTMKHCRTDASSAWRTADWVRIPYPLQWGIPIFSLRTSIIMVIVSMVASVDSVGTYYSVSLKVNSKPPTPGIVSRSIGLEGFCSILAGLWGSGTGSTTLTENIHTIDVTQVANRRALELGAVLLIICSCVGKIGAILASVPQALAASILCFIWALIVALGFSNLRLTPTSSLRNPTIVAVSLFLGLSITAYFQQYNPVSSLILPGYLVPYAAASTGPFYTGSDQIDFAINALMSLNMVVTLVVAFVLENTVPGTPQDSGVYLWSNTADICTDPSFVADYSLPNKVAKLCCWAKCLGA